MEILQKSDNKICLIGYGYWGKIVHKNLLSLGYDNIKIIDVVLDNYYEITDKYTHYFVITPFLSHFDVLKQLSQYNNKKIWCEKPLVQSLDEANLIYHSMESNNNKLFVDWVYTFNPCIQNIKKLIKNKKIKQVILNRTNDGPKRNDCTSIFDLSVHDLSILYYLFDIDYIDMTWNEFSVKSNENFGSNVSWYYNNGLQVIINSSWQHQTKNRVSLLITDDDEIIVFDDIKKLVVSSKGTKDFSDSESPLHSAIDYFFNEYDYSYNKELTLKITKNLEHAI
jgi:predicted dehydrogenase